MKKNKYGFLHLLLIILMSNSCRTNEKTGDTPKETCPKVWAVTRNAGLSANVEINNGVMVLSSLNTSPGLALMAMQNGVSGDFEAGFSFADFVAGDSLGGYIQMALTDPLGMPGNKLLSGIGNVPITGISAVIDSSGSSTSHIILKSSNNKSGSFNVKRSGNLITITTIAGNDTARVSGLYSTAGLTIGLQLGNNFSKQVKGKTSIRITDFYINGGGTLVKSDGFDCNSIKE